MYTEQFSWGWDKFSRKSLLKYTMCKSPEMAIWLKMVDFQLSLAYALESFFVVLKKCETLSKLKKKLFSNKILNSYELNQWLLVLLFFVCGLLNGFDTSYFVDILSKRVDLFKPTVLNITDTDRCKLTFNFLWLMYNNYRGWD